MNWGLILSNEGVASVDHGEERVELQVTKWKLVTGSLTFSLQNPGGSSRDYRYQLAQRLLFGSACLFCLEKFRKSNLKNLKKNNTTEK